MNAAGSPAAGARPRWAWHAAGLAALGGWIVFAALPPRLDAAFALLGGQFALWAAVLGYACATRRAPTAGAVWTWAIAIRAAGLAYLPWLEDDWYRYLWDGFRMLAGADPYAAAPAAFFRDPGVPAAFVPILSGINHPGLATVYGPALQYLFAGAAFIQPAALWPLKLLLAGADLALVGLLGRLASPRMQWAYALCPLVVLEIAFHAHPDGVGAALALAAAACGLHRQRLAAAVLLGVACTVKPWALLLAPWLLRSPAALGACVLTLALLYAPFLAGGDAGLAVLGQVAREWRFNAPVHAALAAVIGPGSARVLLAATLLALWLALAWRLRERQPAPGESVFGAALLLSPVVNPWYLLWVLPFASLRPFVTPWVAAAALPLSYAHGLFLDDPALAPYEVAPAILWLEWGAIALALAVDAWRCGAVTR